METIHNLLFNIEDEEASESLKLNIESHRKEKKKNCFCIFIFVILPSVVSALIYAAIATELYASSTRIAGLATMPILYNGGIATCMKFNNNTNSYTISYAPECYTAFSGIWSAGTTLCNLQPKSPWIAVYPKTSDVPCDTDIDIWLGTVPDYQSLIIATRAAWGCSVIYLIFLILVRSGSYLQKRPRPWLKVLYCFFTVALRIPVFVMMKYLYVLRELQEDHPPKQIEYAEEIELIMFISAFVVETVYQLVENLRFCE